MSCAKPASPPKILLVSTVSNHWLVKTAARLGLIKPEKINKAAGSRIQDIWDEVERISGLSEAEIAARIGPALRVPVAGTLEAASHAIKILPEKIATQYLAFPLDQSNVKLTVATPDPMDISAEQALGFASGRKVEFHIAGPRAIERALRAAYTTDNVDSLVAGLDESLADAVAVLNEVEPDDVDANDAAAKPIVKLTNLILSDAIRDRASDIHIQPVNTVGVVRCRIDGVMHQTMQLPLNAVPRIISRVKVLAQMDIADRVRPQDGRARLSIRNHEYDLRVSTVPVSGGEKAVIRILMPNASARISELGLPTPEMERIDKLLRGRDGVIAVTGPTGSGKTTTLYAALRQLSTGETNIVTVEDPIEYRLPGITQMQADPKRGVTFASALRAVLRQDPDVILIGELRDQETAGIAVQAAMTGHLVLATLHTNDAAGSVARLADLGVERNTLADSLRGALAQRLLRRVCRSCGGKGCDECNRVGYRGRVPVVEVLIVTPEIQELIVKGGSSVEIQRAAVASGMRTMHQVAMEHVRNGVTTAEEVERVLGDGATSHEDHHETPRILIVDDDPTMRQLAALVLKTGGYDTDEAPDGPTGLDKVTRQVMSLVVLDMDMPGMNGLEVLRAIKSNRATAALPVVILTGSDSMEAEAMDAGADDYIRKPLDPERFMARIKAVLRRAQSG